MKNTQDKKLEIFSYDNKIVKYFSMATLVWGGVALALGVFIATQLANWRFNFGIGGRRYQFHYSALT